MLTAVAGYDSEMAVNDPNNTNADMTALVNAFPASVDTARASLDNLDNFLSALEQDLAAVLVWAIRNPVGSEDVSALRFGGGANWLNAWKWVRICLNR